MPEGFYIGKLFIHFYGVIIMFGAVLAAWLSTVEAKRRGLNPDLVLGCDALALNCGDNRCKNMACSYSSCVNG